MDINNWCNSSSQNLHRQGKQSCTRSGYHRILSFNMLAIGSKIPRWRMLWRKIMREKKRIFDCSSPATTRVHVPYDPYTYSQNFDQDSMWSDPDNVSRSFSARFAVPSRIFEESGPVG